MVLEVPPSRVPIAGPPAHTVLGFFVAVVALVVGFALLGRLPTAPARLPSQPAARATAPAALSSSQAPRLGVTVVAPPSPQTLLGISATEAWSASWVDGLWHFQDGIWSKVPVAGWVYPLRVLDVARSPDKRTLAAATEYGAAVLRAGEWHVLELGEVHDVTFDGDGTLWLATWSDSTETTVTTFAFDGRAWHRKTYPPLTVPSRPRLAIGPDGEPWVGSCGYVGSFARFDAGHWVEVSPFGEPEVLCIVDLATTPGGTVWVSTVFPNVDDGGWSWAVADYHGSVWTVHPASDIGPAQGSLGEIAIDPNGSVWVATGRGLARFDGQDWTVLFPGDGFAALSVAADGAIWAVGGTGLPGVQPMTASTASEPAAPAPAGAGTVSVTISDVTRAAGSRLEAILVRGWGSSTGPEGVGGFSVLVDADPFTVTELVRAGPPALAPAWPAFGQRVTSVPSGEHTIMVFVSETLSPYSFGFGASLGGWIPADSPDLRQCVARVTIAADEATEIHVTGIPGRGAVLRCPIE